MSPGRTSESAPNPYFSSITVPLAKGMIKLWPSTPGQATPRAAPGGGTSLEPNPFDNPALRQQNAVNTSATSSSGSSATTPPPSSPTTSFSTISSRSSSISTTIPSMGYSTPSGARTPTLASPGQAAPPNTLHHQLLNTHLSDHLNSVASPALLTPPAGPTTALTTSTDMAFPTTLTTKDFTMKPPPTRRRDLIPSPSTSPKSSSPITANGGNSGTRTPTASGTSPPAPATSAAATTNGNGNGNSTAPKGQLRVKLIQARGLNVSHVHARPYVVVQFEQNEFVSREPTSESSKEVKGVAVLSRNNSSSALNSLNAASGITKALEQASRSKAGSAAGTTSTTPAAPATPNGIASPAANLTVGKGLTPSATTNGSTTPSLFGGLSPHDPVWKHEVSFDVTSEQSLIKFTVYDRAVEVEGFLGTLEIKPVLVHDRAVDQWYKLQSREGETFVTGEIRIQITYEQVKTKRPLTPRDFEFLKLIGRGTFGRVFQVRKKDTKRIYAMKVLSKKEIVAKKEVAHTIGERKILQTSLECPFLVSLKFSFQTDTELYLVTDFKSGGELFWHLQKETRFTEERARFYIAELVLALEHLHKYDIVYRDLKPENILLDATGHVALCDFGLSKPDLAADQLTNTFCGTTEYLAPEVLLDDHGYSKLVDFWSLGVLLFEMCCGWSPFYAEDTQQMYKNICFGRIRFPRNVIGEDGKQFVKGLLNRNPKHRLGAERDAAELKEHPFFKHIDWRALALKQVVPPFRPVVESDESTANFDPEFTSADVRDSGIDIFDEDDPSDAWAASFGASNPDSLTHTYNGPNGGVQGDYSSYRGGVAIKTSRRRNGQPMGTPLTNSVQEKFRGFTYSAESMMPQAAGLLAQSLRDGDGDFGMLGPDGRLGAEEAVEDEEEDVELVTDPGIEDDEWEDETPQGRYAGRRLDDDISIE